MVATGESKALLLLGMLVEGEMLTIEQRERVIALEGQDGRSTLQIIDDERMVDPEQLVVAAGLFLGVPFVNLKRQEIEEEAIQVVPEWICRKFGVVPIRVREGTVYIAMADPSDLQQVDEVSATLRRPVEAALAMHRDIDEAIDRREGCAEEPIRAYLTTDHVVVGDDSADTQLAELFIHHRVSVIPIATEGRVHAVLSRNDFFRALAERICDPIEHYLEGRQEASPED